MLTSRQKRDISVATIICLLVGITVSVNDAWTLHNPRMILNEMPYLAAIFALVVGIIFLRDSQATPHRTAASLVLALANIGVGLWQFMHNDRVAASLMLLAGSIFGFDLFKSRRTE